MARSCSWASENHVTRFRASLMNGGVSPNSRKMSSWRMPSPRSIEARAPVHGGGQLRSNFLILDRYVREGTGKGVEQHSQQASNRR
jgi:hypothetical protein